MSRVFGQLELPTHLHYACVRIPPLITWLAYILLLLLRGKPANLICDNMLGYFIADRKRDSLLPSMARPALFGSYTLGGAYNFHL